MPVHVLTHPACQDHVTPDGRAHVERPERITAATQGLRESPLDLAWEQAPVAKVDTLRTLHTGEHVHAVEAACQRGRWIGGDPDLIAEASDTYAVPASWEAALAGVGGAIRAAELALDGAPALSLCRPPGHHATAQRAMGFCLFNQIALAADHVARTGKRVAVLDIDVHHGNGTQDILYERGDVLYISTHQSPLYPGTGHPHEVGRGDGAGFTVNLPLPPGVGHAGYLEVLDKGVLPVLEAHRPELVLISAGFDAHAKDPLGGLDLVSDTFHATGERLANVAPHVAAVLEGGYSLEALTTSVPALMAGLSGEPCPVNERLEPGVRAWPMLASPLATYHGARWGILPG
ncbi:MAG: histone deacetylase [Candidatus Thermoplasmatota archaeon]|nr:histone deacetylase [Candidatus Thermoplasmatota archaeon]